MNAFQQSLTAEHPGQDFAGSVLSKWGSQYWLRAGRARLGARRNARTPLPVLIADSPLPVARCGTCQHFRSDPAWVAGVFSGFPGTSSAYTSACAADGVCRLSHRARSTAFSCGEFVR